MSAAAETSGLEGVRWSDYDFIDLGCSNGGSLRHCRKRFGARRGIGVDLDPDKVAQTRELGLDAELGDATKLRLVDTVRFVSMMDFLEHLPALEQVEQSIASAAQAATDFIFISHPSFEGEERLRAQGLMQYWWNWSGHPSHIRVSDYCGMFERLGLRQYFIRYREPIHDSAHPSVLPTGGGRNQRLYDPEKHGPKPEVAFAEPIWRGQEIFVALRAFTPSEWHEVTASRPAT